MQYINCMGQKSFYGENVQGIIFMGALSQDPSRAWNASPSWNEITHLHGRVIILTQFKVLIDDFNGIAHRFFSQSF